MAEKEKSWQQLAADLDQWREQARAFDAVACTGWFISGDWSLRIEPHDDGERWCWHVRAEHVELYSEKVALVVIDCFPTIAAALARFEFRQPPDRDNAGLGRGQLRYHIARMFRCRRQRLGLTGADLAAPFEFNNQLPTDEQLAPLAELLEVDVAEIVAHRILDRMGVYGNSHTLHHARAIAKMWLVEHSDLDDLEEVG